MDELLEFIIVELVMQMVVPMVAAHGIDVALNMCGNAGQISIIEMTEGGFIWGAEYTCADAGEAYFYIQSECPYPEAVSDILETAGEAMDDLAQSIRESLENAGDMF